MFTITEGLENLGALKTGGQGSVYKGKRIGEIITAVKLLPTPILSEDNQNKNYIDFQNEVQKLKRVNEIPSPHVVKILSSGITDTGCFPFIEMEFIQGPDLGELLKPPHDPVFTNQESIKVATHLAGAIAHCHKVNVKHGDIKSNNVKYNVESGNYVLLDFGLAIMSDEQRRTSLRQAGAIEFMAPEQNEGEMLFESDVYSFGIIMYELLAGQVPFPLKDGGETARNQVRLAHMEAPIPELMPIRKSHLPGNWSTEKKEHEMNVPVWLLNTIEKCLGKKPQDRFKNGMDLYDHLLLNIAISNKNTPASIPGKWESEKDQILSENKNLQKQLAEKQLKIDQLEKLAEIPVQSKKNKKVSGKIVSTFIFITIMLAALAVYGLFFDASRQNSFSKQSIVAADSTAIKDSLERANRQRTEPGEKNEKKPMDQLPDTSGNLNLEIPDENNIVYPVDSSALTQESELHAISTKYKVRSKAYLYTEPDENKRGSDFIFQWNNTTLVPLDEKNDFIYVSFTSPAGQSYKGWLRKKDLLAIE